MGQPPSVCALVDKAADVDDLIDEAAWADPYMQNDGNGWYAEQYDEYKVSGLVKNLVKRGEVWQYQSAVSALSTIKIIDTETEIANIRNALDGWDSEALRAYTKYHLNVYPACISRQDTVLGILKGTMGGDNPDGSTVGYAGAINSAYQGIEDALDAARKALRKIIDGDAGDSSKFGEVVIKTAIAVIGVAVTGGEAAALGFAMLSEPVNTTLAGMTVGGSETEKVAKSIHSAVSKKKGELEDYERFLKRALKEARDAVADMRAITSYNPEPDNLRKPIEIPSPDF